MREVKKHIQNWTDIRIADISKLSAIGHFMIIQIQER